jgi:ribosomal subunit interface protein
MTCALSSSEGSARRPNDQEANVRIQIESPDFPLTRAMREFLERRLRYGLTRSDDRIGLVEVHLSDVNGARGGVDKRCRIRVHLHNKSDVVVEDTETDLYFAMNRAAARVGRTVARRIAKRLAPRRRRFTGVESAATRRAAPFGSY